MPVLIPAQHGDLESLLRAMDALERAGGPISPTPCSIPSISASRPSIGRYAELRRRRPDAEILMGTGNLTELTDADSRGSTPC